MSTYKCWIHGVVDEGEKKPSKLKEHSGFPDPSPNFQQNLAIVLKPGQTSWEQKIAELEAAENQRQLLAEKHLQKLEGEKAEFLKKEKDKKTELETKTKQLRTKEMELSELTSTFNSLVSYFHNLELSETWYYVSNLIQDYFATIKIAELELKETGKINIPKDSTFEKELKKKEIELGQLKEQINQLKAEIKNLKKK